MSVSVFQAPLYGVGGLFVFQRVVHTCATSVSGCDSSCARMSKVARPMPRLAGYPPQLPASRPGPSRLWLCCCAAASPETLVLHCMGSC